MRASLITLTACCTAASVALCGENRASQLPLEPLSILSVTEVIAMFQRSPAMSRFSNSRLSPLSSASISARAFAGSASKASVRPGLRQSCSISGACLRARNSRFPPWPRRSNARCAALSQGAESLRSDISRLSGRSMAVAPSMPPSLAMSGAAAVMTGWLVEASMVSGSQPLPANFAAWYHGRSRGS